MRLRFEHSIFIEDKVGSTILRLVPAIRRFEAEAEPQLQIWSQPKRVLYETSAFERAPSKLCRRWNNRKRRNRALQKCGDAPKGGLSILVRREIAVRLKPLNPDTRFQLIFTVRDVHVVIPRKEIARCSQIASRI